MPKHVRAAPERTVDTAAFVVRRVNVGDADVMATLFTRERGIVSAAARGARGPKSKLGPIEPLHTMRVRLEIVQRSDVAKLREATVLRPRLGLVADAERLEAASRLLRWLRSLAPAQAPEPKAFDLVDAALDRLEEVASSNEVVAALAVSGLGLAAAFGYRLELDACVRCGTAYPPAASAFVDPAAGGVVCRACGGGGILVRGALRATLLRALSGEEVQLGAEDAALALELAERVIGVQTPQEARR
jgi:DNA repair protein RecO (recombination protein O)